MVPEQEVVLGALKLRIQRPMEPRDPLRVAWSGKSDDVHPSRFLAPHFQVLLEEASKRGAAVEFRFEELDYLNSSTLTVLAQFIRECRSRSVRLVMVYDPDRKWQRLSFDALRVFVTGDGALELRALGESIR